MQPRLRNLTLLIVYIGFFMLLAPLPNLARVAQSAPVRPTFEKVDRNGDGYIDRFEAASLRGLGAVFAGADTNRDGRLNKIEFARIP